MRMGKERALWGYSAAGHGADDEQRFCTAGDRFGQRRVGKFVRPIFLAGEVAHERAAAQGAVLADGPGQGRMKRLQGIKHIADGGWSLDGQLHLTFHPRERAQVIGEHDADHGKVWTSTDKTAGRSRTIAFHVSPLSGET